MIRLNKKSGDQELILNLPNEHVFRSNLGNKVNKVRRVATRDKM